MKALVDQLGPQPHPRPIVSIGRAQRGLGKGVLQVFQDDLRFADHLAIVNQRRHHAARIDRQVFWVVLIAPAEPGVNIVTLPLQSLFGKR